MGFITVNHGLNEIINIEVNAIEQSVKLAIKAIKSVELVSEKVQISPYGNDVKIEIIVKADKTFAYSELLPKLEKEINEKISNLIGAKPTNIQIVIEEK